MIKSTVLILEEIDDADDAKLELQQKLAEITLCKNTVGIVTVHPDFVLLCCEIASSFPFPTVGTTTFTQLAGEEVSVHLFSVLVLTSDDCEFACGISDEIPPTGDVTVLSQNLYKSLAEKLPSEPKLAYLVHSFLPGHYSYKYLSAISAVNEKLPIFGTVANDLIATTPYDTNATPLYCGESKLNNLVMVLVSGNIEPKFYVSKFSDDYIALRNVGKVTKAEENRLYEINGVPVLEFLSSLGIEIAQMANGATMIFSNSDDDFVARVLITAQDDYIVLAGNVAVGAMMSVAIQDKTIILKTATEIMNQIKNDFPTGTVLLYSCLFRRYTLLNEPLLEYEVLRDGLVSGNYTVTAACASGEICPTKATADEVINREHNQSLIACVF
jgi:hypothetical protein